LQPTHIEFDQEVSRVSAEGINGSFALLERHIDFATALAPGVLIYTPVEGGEGYLAVNGGTVVKRGAEVFVSTVEAVRGDRLEDMRRAVAERFRELDEHEQRARYALQRMQADFIRKYVELEL